MEIKYRIPRKLKKKIPVGMYCYVYTGETSLVWNEEIKQNVTAFGIKPCGFYKSIQCRDKPLQYKDELDFEYPEEFIGWCKMLKCEIEDQCKSCGFKKYKS